MKKLFMSLLDLLKLKGELSEAIMYEGGSFSRLKVTTETGTYSISISKETEANGTENKR